RVLAALEGAAWSVAGIRKSERKRSPYAPFETATLQQEAARKLGFSSRRTMTVAQQLYEGIDLGGETGTTGLITYMRTDSTRIAPEAQTAAREHIRTHYGERYVPEKPNVYKSKGAAQEAHEAIRPTEVGLLPDTVKARLSADQHKLYRLIWLRFLSSQMSAAIFDAVSVDIAAAGFTFRATGSTVRFDGFLRIYNEGKDNPEQVDDDERPPLPPLVEGQGLDLVALVPKQHFSEPPPRYTEATMVKTLKEKEIGRPSTYASILSTIVARSYVELKERKFHPTDLGFAVTDLLVEAFPTVLDVQFTAEMERSLDEVEEGRRNWVALMRDFWNPLSRSIESAQERSFAKTTGEQCPECGGDLVEKFGRFGKFQSCSNYPTCKYIKRDRPAEGEAAEPVVSDIPCPQCGKLLVEKSGRFGKFLGCPGYPECKYIHKAAPKTTGITCPDCGKAEIVEKRSRTGVFYGCAGYPKCKLTLSGKPLERPCPKCGGLLHEKAFRGRVSGIVCVNAKKGCDHTEKVASAPAGDAAEG
ncbi:MAG: DNA topoisomerase, partial [Armatimonadota bacterium]